MAVKLKTNENGIKYLQPGVNPQGKEYMNPYGASMPNAEKKPTTPATNNNNGNDTGIVSGGNYGGTPSGGNGTITGISQPVNDRINSQFAPSQAYLDAMNYTNGLLQQLSSGRTSYTDQIQGMLDKIQNRDPFAYDVDTDTLFQQYLASQTNAGRGAMQDTMGQAAALTGGYGSSYATTAGNQAYNAYIRGAYDNLPQYYQLARDAYDKEGDELYRQYGLLSDADQKEYQRLYDAYNANFGNAQTQYGNEFQAWNADVSNAFNLAQMQNSDYWQRYSAAQSAASKAQSQANADRQYELELMKLAQSKDEAERKSAQEQLALMTVTPEERQKMYETGAKLYSEGGEWAVNDWLGTLPDKYASEAEGFAAYMDGTYRDLEDGTRVSNYDGAARQTIPVAERSYMKNAEGKFVDIYNNEYSFDELKKLLGAANARKLNSAPTGQVTRLQ